MVLMLNLLTTNPESREPELMPIIQHMTDPILIAVLMRDCGAMTDVYVISATKVNDDATSLKPPKAIKG